MVKNNIKPEKLDWQDVNQAASFDPSPTEKSKSKSKEKKKKKSSKK